MDITVTFPAEKLEACYNGVLNEEVSVTYVYDTLPPTVEYLPDSTSSRKRPCASDLDLECIYTSTGLTGWAKSKVANHTMQYSLRLLKSLCLFKYYGNTFETSSEKLTTCLFQ